MSNLLEKKETNYNKPNFESWSFSKINYFLFGIGLVFIIIGFLVMQQGPEGVDSFESVTLSPIMLFLGYIIFIPSALLYRVKKSEKLENRDRSSVG
ncbi:MAG: hypothetical protein CMG74_05920 [Candidatus Marinimicrobia bacterium]|nr:hypothetical protein [Candidatus Neomarinimicrobiota bacterium]|tara:strand:- start:24 stop:311 length:288 start_codon:yes stop_codon:yes gene_type:complete